MCLFPPSADGVSTVLLLHWIPASHPIPGSQRRIHCQTLQQTGYCSETQATLGGFPRSVRLHGPDEQAMKEALATGMPQPTS